MFWAFPLPRSRIWGKHEAQISLISTLHKHRFPDLTQGVFQRSIWSVLCISLNFLILGFTGLGPPGSFLDSLLGLFFLVLGVPWPRLVAFVDLLVLILTFLVSAWRCRFWSRFGDPFGKVWELMVELFWGSGLSWGLLEPLSELLGESWGVWAWFWTTFL